MTTASTSPEPRSWSTTRGHLFEQAAPDQLFHELHDLIDQASGDQLVDERGHHAEQLFTQQPVDEVDHSVEESCFEQPTDDGPEQALEPALGEVDGERLWRGDLTFCDVLLRERPSASVSPEAASSVIIGWRPATTSAGRT